MGEICLCIICEKEVSKQINSMRLQDSFTYFNLEYFQVVLAVFILVCLTIFSTFALKMDRTQFNIFLIDSSNKTAFESIFSVDI